MFLNINLQSLDRKISENGLISNIYDLTVKTDRKRGLFDIFKPCILSCEVGLEKPQKEIYELALRELRVDAMNCVFTDNKPEYLKIPKELGFHVIHFQNNTQFIRELKKIGIKF
jgi:putative hydrolase of the HAD superfamily